MQIRLAAPLDHDSIVDGEGIRTVIWTQGCIHNCLGCHNPETHDFNGGLLVDIEDIKKEISLTENQNGVTFSGGDPMCQPEPCSILAKYIHSLNLNVWCYTGYTYETLIEMSKTNKYIKDFLDNIDILIDGKFMIELKSMDILFRGSSNQRIIDVKESLKKDEVVLVDKYMEPIDRKSKVHTEPYIYI